MTLLKFGFPSFHQMAAAEIQATMHAKESQAQAEIRRIAQERERAEKLRQALKQRLDKAKARIERTGVGG